METTPIKSDFYGYKSNRLIKREQESVAGRLKTGRSSIPDHNGLYNALFGEMALVKPDFHEKVFELMEFLGKYNADLSYAIDNIVQLGNTEWAISFDDAISEDDAADMVMHIKRKSKSWYAHSGGLNSLVDDMLAQIALTGALSAEIVPDNDLKGVKKGVLVNPKNIEFLYDRDKDEYEAYQKGIASGMFSLHGDIIDRVKLNTVTYKYYAIRRFNEKPYAIPPFLSALEAINIEKDMMCNFKHIIKQLGVFGFMQVLMKAPTRKTPQFNGGLPETDEAYQARLQKYLDEQIPEIEKSLAKGFVAGFEGSHKFEMKGNLSNPEGAKSLFELNTQIKMAGLKQDPLMLGRNFNTTESLGAVIIKKLTAQLMSYQKLVKTFLEEMFLIELQLAFPEKNVQFVDVEFEPPMLEDRVKAEQAFGLKIKNYNDLYNQGVVTQQQRSQALGWEEPALDEPIMTSMEEPPDDLKVDNTDKKKKEREKSFLRGHVEEFDYMADGICTCEHTHTELNFSLSDKEAEKIVTDYLEASTKNFSAAMRRAVIKIGKRLVQLGADPTIEAVMDAIYYNLYKEVNASFLPKQRKIINKWITKGYNIFRKDTSPFAHLPTSFQSKIPRATFDLIDFKTIDYFKNSDGLYMGKFITDADTSKKIHDFIMKHYFETGEINVGRDPKAINLFRKQFGSLLEGEDWKIRRIINTTVNTMKSYASVQYMNQVVEKYEVRGINDRLQCGFCAEMQGKQFSVTKAVTLVDDVVNSEPSLVKVKKPFINSVFKTVDDLKAASIEDIENKGVMLPSYHPGCRDRVIAVL